MALSSRAASIALALLVPLGCKQGSKHSPPAAASGGDDDGADAPPKPEAPKPWVEAPRTHLLVQRHAPKQDTAEYLPVALADGLRAEAPVSLAAIANPRWPDHYLAPAAHGGGERFVAVAGEAEAWTLAVYQAGKSKPRQGIEFKGEHPAAMHLAGDKLLLGQANTVTFFDLGAERPRWTLLHTLEDMQFKAYDLFARSGDWLIAIDDVVTPIYADSFGLTANKAPKHEAGWQLPGAINGHYYAATLVPSGDGDTRDGTLYALVAYGIMSGNGHNLTALEIVDGELKFESGAIVNSGAGGSLAVLEEHVDRGSGEPSKLLAGEDYSEWTALAHHRDASGERLLLCAEARDILVAPTQFKGLSELPSIELEGDCLDLLVDGERLWVIVDPEPRERAPAEEWAPPTTSKLLELKLEAPAKGEGPPKASVVDSLELPGHHRFVR